MARGIDYDAKRLEPIFTPSSVEDWPIPVFRVLTSLIFIIGGIGAFGEHSNDAWTGW